MASIRASVSIDVSMPRQSTRAPTVSAPRRNHIEQMRPGAGGRPSPLANRLTVPWRTHLCWQVKPVEFVKGRLLPAWSLTSVRLLIRLCRLLPRCQPVGPPHQGLIPQRHFEHRSFRGGVLHVIRRGAGSLRMSHSTPASNGCVDASPRGTAINFHHRETVAASPNGSAPKPR